MERSTVLAHGGIRTLGTDACRHEPHAAQPGLRSFPLGDAARNLPCDLYDCVCAAVPDPAEDLIVCRACCFAAVLSFGRGISARRRTFFEMGAGSPSAGTFRRRAAVPHRARIATARHGTTDGILFLG